MFTLCVCRASSQISERLGRGMGTHIRGAILSCWKPCTRTEGQIHQETEGKLTQKKQASFLEGQDALWAGRAL